MTTDVGILLKAMNSANWPAQHHMIRNLIAKTPARAVLNISKLGSKCQWNDLLQRLHWLGYSSRVWRGSSQSMHLAPFLFPRYVDLYPLFCALRFAVVVSKQRHRFCDCCCGCTKSTEINWSWHCERQCTVSTFYCYVCLFMFHSTVLGLKCLLCPRSTGICTATHQSSKGKWCFEVWFPFASCLTAHSNSSIRAYLGLPTLRAFCVYACS